MNLYFVIRSNLHSEDVSYFALPRGRYVSMMCWMPTMGRSDELTEITAKETKNFQSNFDTD